MRILGCSLLVAGLAAIAGCKSGDKSSPIPLTTVQCMSLGGTVGQDGSCPRTQTKLFGGDIQGQFRCNFPAKAGVCIENSR